MEIISKYEKTVGYRLSQKFYLTMKLILIFCFLSFLSVMAEDVYSQKARVTLEMEKATLREVFDVLRTQNGYSFWYRDNEIDLNRNVSVVAKEKPVQEILDELLKPLQMNYVINDKHIIIFEEEKQAARLPQAADKREVSGQVTDERGEPIPGVAILLKGTETGTTTDIDGKYTLLVAKGDVLQFSFIGYRPHEVLVQEQVRIDVMLREDVQQLDEVVVTGYGGTQIRSKLTNSIASVEKEHMNVGLFSNPAQALSGAVAGLRIQQSSGNPAAIPAVVLRGGTNLDGSGSPLILVDGQQRESMADINAEDIESMEVLKDAGATALYGARANNGVILITTKRGKTGRMVVNVKAKVGLNYMNNPYEFLDAGEYLYWMRTAFQRSAQIFQTSSGQWVGTTDMSSLKSAQPYGTGNIYWADTDKTIPANGNEDGRATWSPMIYTDDLAFLLKEGWKVMTDPVYGDKIIYKDWNMAKANIVRPAITQDYNINLSGGNEKGSYYVGLGYNYSEGLPLNNYYRRFTATFNGDYKVNNWLTSYTNFSFADSKKNGLPNGREAVAQQEDIYFTSMLSAPPTMRGYAPDGELLIGDDDENGNMAVNLNKFIRKYNTDKFTLGQSLKFDVTDGLYVKVGGMMMFDEELNESFDRDYIRWAEEWNRSRKSSAYLNRTLSQTYNVVVNYDMRVAREHTLNVLAGFEFYDEYTKGFSAAGSGAPTDDFADLELTSTGEKMRNTDSWHERQRIMSFFGRLNYDYKGKYLLSATMRQDGYSILLDDNRWGFFPGVSAGWVFGREKFMEGLSSVVSFAKLRMSYGLNGNVSNISGENVKNGAYDLQGSYITTPYGGDFGYLPGKLPNPGLSWEKSHTFEAGLDMSFLENKINANFTFYNRKTQDKYADIPLPGSSGISTFRTNNGMIRNRGFEFELGFKVLRTTDFSWDIRLNGAYNRNKILKLPKNGLERNRQNAFQVYDGKTGQLKWVGGYQEGQEPGMLYAFKAEGLYRNEVEIPGNLIDRTSGNNGSNGLVLYGPQAWANLPESEKVTANGRAAALPVQPGDVKWKDVNGDGVIDDYDMVKMGNRMPHWTGGINTTFKYKGLTFYARMDYALDFKVYDGRTAWMMGNMVGYYNTLKQTKNSWTPENPKAKYPTYTWADQLEKRNYARPSSMFVYDGSYLAFREIALTYAFPKKWLDRAFISNLEVSVTGQNLGYLTEAKNVFSPEVSNEDSGTKYPRNGGYPLPRTVIFGLNLTF